MELSAQTIQLAMLGGESAKRTPSAGIFPYKSPWGTGALYVFAETKGANSEYVCRLVIEAIGREFKASNRSLTASLGSAIKATHRQLLSENRRSLRDHQATVGVTCLVLREDELYFAQAGPAVGYALLGGQITRIPAASSRALPSWSTPLGGGDQIEVSLARHKAQPGDVVLMASSLLATKPVESMLPELMALGAEGVVHQLEYRLREEPFFSALSIGFVDQSKPEARPAPPVAAAPAPKKGSLPSASGIIAAALSRIRLPSVDRKKAGDALRTFLPDGDNGRGPSHEKAVRSNGRRKVPVPTLEATGKVTAAKEAEEDTLVMAWSNRVGTVRERNKVSLPPQPKRSRARNLRLPLFLLVLVLAGLIACSAVAYFTRFAEKQSEDRFASVLNAAAVTRERGLNAGELSQSRRLLNDADQLVSEALLIGKNDPKARALKQRIAADLAKLNAVVGLPEAKMLTDLAKVEGGAKNVTSLVVEGEDAFILDRGSSRVYQFGIDLASGTLKVGKSTLVAKKGDKVGDTPVADIVSILWMNAGGGRPTSNLLIFDSARNVFEYTPGKSLTLLKVRGSQSWLNPAVAIGYNSNLYVLDPSASQVWRYFPTFNGYDSEMRGLLENAEIKDAVDFAIDRDIFVLTRGGRVLKFIGGRPESFSLDQLDKGLANPNAIFTSSKTKSVYILDAGNNRVLVFSKDGKFQRQFVGDVLDESPRGIHVDEERGKLYILSDKKLYLSGLPK